MPKKAPLHRPWRTCGRRERETDAGRPRGVIHVAACDFAAVKGTLIVRMPLPFAGRRWSGGLGRLVYARNGSLPFRVSAPVTRGVPWTPRRGTIVGVRHQSHAAVRAAALTAHSFGDTSFTRSKGPCSSIVTHFAGESRRRWRAGRGFAVGQTGQPEEPTPTPRSSDEARLDAHPPLAREQPGAFRKGRRLRPPSLRGTRESRSECPHVVCSCRSRERRHLVSNKLTCSTLKKGTRRE